jgi:hypothetical protein
MKPLQKLLLVLLTGSVVLFTGCGNGDAELRKDVRAVADAMCRITGAMNHLKAADPVDSVGYSRLLDEVKKSQEEMTTLNRKFQEKYKDRIDKDDFRKIYSKEIRKAILDCEYLTKEDKERFAKETE